MLLRSSIRINDIKENKYKNRKKVIIFFLRNAFRHQDNVTRMQAVINM